jgi:hypothetical protein
MRWAVGISLLLAILAGCAHSPVGRVRFHNRPPVWKVQDRRPAPKPEVHEYHRFTGNIEDVLRRPVLFSLRTPTPKRAQNVNSLGEVPNSTWFTNRVGVRDVDPLRIRKGPPGGCAPYPQLPLRVLKRKEGGVQLGFLVKDACGDRFILKFDPKGKPGLRTGADAVVSRLLWTVGYHVPDDDVIEFTRDDIKVAKDATRGGAPGTEVALTPADLTRALSKAGRTESGKWRALASRYLEGVPVGGYPMTGTRPDDPNDRVPHQHRRDVRGQKVFFAWLGHTDVKEDNTLDMWHERPEGSGRGYLTHHLVDFEVALGVKNDGGTTPQDGWAHQFDYPYAGASLLTFGLWKRPWEDIPLPDLPAVGGFQRARYFEPEHFHTTRPYEPFFWTDRFDAYWASKILIRVRREHIEAAVSAGRYAHRRSHEYLVETLMGRQRKTARHWFRQVNPVDRFRLRHTAQGPRLCARDLMLAYQLADLADETRYQLTAHDYAGRGLDWSTTLHGQPEGRLCTRLPSPPTHHGGYTMVRYETHRGPRTLPATVVHLAQAPDSGKLRIIGIRRR